MSELHDRPSPVLRIWCCILGALSLSGLFFAIEGGKLISLGGSWYFLIAGIVMLFSAVQYFRSKILCCGVVHSGFFGDADLGVV